MTNNNDAITGAPQGLSQAVHSHSNWLTADPIDHAALARSKGKRSALVTLVGIDGAAPRPVGAQMSVWETGETVGYLSGGCLEKAVTLEAIDAMKNGKNRLLRYGQGSPYIDIKLPCGSGLDIYIDQGIDDQIIEQANRLRSARRPFAMETDLLSGKTSIVPFVGSPSALSPSERSGNQFVGRHVPRIRIIIFGAGPTAVQATLLAQTIGAETTLYSPEADQLGSIAGDHTQIEPLPSPKISSPPAIDPWTAILLAFHDHDWEIPILTKLLSSESFYIGAIGNRNVALDRRTALENAGVSPDNIDRLKSPAGLIKNAKSAPELALGILTEVMAEARSKALVL